MLALSLNKELHSTTAQAKKQQDCIIFLFISNKGNKSKKMNKYIHETMQSHFPQHRLWKLLF